MSHEPEAPASAPSLQKAVLRLQEFWMEKGCVLLPPCDFQVPYATLQPEAFFRLLEPEPWRAACLQPVRRPLDGRRGEHPYRLLKHLQLQVVLKPPPEDAAALYLESLEALGLELQLHDLRFAEWNWRPISLGARGSGWHALIDGLGVARLTFLDRIAGRDLDPICVEIAYGVERLMMVLQGTTSAFDVRWAQSGPEIGRWRRRDEEELSRYVFEVADGGDLRRRLEALEGEAKRALEAGLARPAYELAVRCLEPIDVLEARGELSARERASRLERVGRRVAAAAVLHLTGEPSTDEASVATVAVAEKKKGKAVKKAKTAKRAKKAAPARRPKRSRKARKPATKDADGGGEKDG